MIVDNEQWVDKKGHNDGQHRLLVYYRRKEVSLWLMPGLKFSHNREQDVFRVHRSI